MIIKNGNFDLFEEYELELKEGRERYTKEGKLL